MMIQSYFTINLLYINVIVGFICYFLLFEMDISMVISCNGDSERVLYTLMVTIYAVYVLKCRGSLYSIHWDPLH
jgi:hypothetical protein